MHFGRLIRKREFQFTTWPREGLKQSTTYCGKPDGGDIFSMINAVLIPPARPNYFSR